MMDEQRSLTALRQNIDSLLVEAGILFRRRRFALSTHLSILCAEECSKFAVAICKENLPDEVFRKRFQHPHKHRVFSTHWFISGGLSVVYLVHVAAQEGFLGDDVWARKYVLADLSKSCGWNDPERLAHLILKCIETRESELEQAELEASIKKREKDRRNSVYVDLDEHMNVIACPSQIDRDKAKGYLRDARIAVSVIRFLCSTELDLVGFVQTLPRGMRTEIQNHAREMVEHVRSKEVPSGHLTA